MTACRRCPTVETARNNLHARNVNASSVVLTIWRNTVKSILNKSPINVHNLIKVSHNLETLIATHVGTHSGEKSYSRVPIAARGSPPNATLSRFIQETSPTLVCSVSPGQPTFEPISGSIQERNPTLVYSASVSPVQPIVCPMSKLMRREALPMSTVWEAFLQVSLSSSPSQNRYRREPLPLSTVWQAFLSDRPSSVPSENSHRREALPGVASVSQGQTVFISISESIQVRSPTRAPIATSASVMLHMSGFILERSPTHVHSVTRDFTRHVVFQFILGSTLERNGIQYVCQSCDKRFSSWVNFRVCQWIHTDRGKDGQDAVRPSSVVSSLASRVPPLPVPDASHWWEVLIQLIKVKYVTDYNLWFLISGQVVFADLVVVFVHFLFMFMPIVWLLISVKYTLTLWSDVWRL